MENNNNIILEVKGLKKYFPLQKDMLGRPKAYLRAVDDVTFKLAAGKTIGVVGESGCGKTTLGRTILQLYDTTGGKTLYYGHNLDEFLPKYYLEGINNLPSLAKKFVSYKLKLANFIKDINEDLTLAEYKELLYKIENKSLDLNENDSNKAKDIVNNIIGTLIDASVITGGYILTNTYDAKKIILDIVNKKNLIFKNLKNKEKLLKKESVDNDAIAKIDEEINDLNNEINKLILLQKELSKDLVNNQLFIELEQLKETGIDLAKLTKEEMRSLRTEIQLIFQDPYSSLPPRMTIGDILTEPVKVHHIVENDKVNEHVRKVMKMCGLQPQYYDRYPHEFSGGQRQRICIARALVVNPKLVICDEPVSALDVSIQAQIINLLKDLQKSLGLTYMFISHDLSVVKYITDSIIVMYLGNMMEIADTKDIFENPLHPYTKALFSAVPIPDPEAKMNRIILKGDIPSPANPPKGCKFHTRCDKCMSVCKLLPPKFIHYNENHVVACHLYDNEIMDNLSKYDAQIKELENEEQNKDE